MEILNGIETIDKYGLFIKKFRALVVADLHIGYEAALEKQGIMIPISQYPKLKKILFNMINKVSPDVLIINGDIKHEFGEATSQEWVEVLDLLDTLKKNKIETIVVRGNHDNYLIPLLKKYNIDLKDPYLKIGSILITHGHKEIGIIDKEIKTIIIGHEHPAIVIKDELGIKRKFKCFLRGKVYGKNLLVLPSLSPIMYGSEVNVIDKNSLLSPILRAANLDEFDAIVIEDKAYVFPLKYISV